MNSFVRKIIKIAATGLFGGSVYLLGEMIFRQITGRTPLHIWSPLMFLMGSCSFLGVVAFIRLPVMKYLTLKAVAGGLWITATEAFFGLTLLDTAGVRTWSYLKLPYNYRGVICLEWSLLWIVLSGIAVVAEKIYSEKSKKRRSGFSKPGLITTHTRRR